MSHLWRIPHYPTPSITNTIPTWPPRRQGWHTSHGILPRKIRCLHKERSFPSNSITTPRRRQTLYRLYRDRLSNLQPTWITLSKHLATTLPNCRRPNYSTSIIHTWFGTTPAAHPCSLGVVGSVPLCNSPPRLGIFWLVAVYKYRTLSLPQPHVTELDASFGLGKWVHIWTPFYF